MVQGRSFRGREAYFGTPTRLILSSGQFQSSTAIGITDFENGCSNYSSTMPVGALLGIELYTDRSQLDASVMEPGEFAQDPATIGSGVHLAVVNYTLYSMQDQTTINATAASVRIARVSSTKLSGSIDVAIGGDSISGSFDASHCAYLDDAH
jgi:hypothetical protein